MKKAFFVHFTFLFAILFLLAACNSPDVVRKEDLPISCPDAFADVLSIEDGKMRVFDLSDGITYTQLVGEMFSEEELDLQFYSDNGKITMKQPITFSETGKEQWIISFFFEDEQLVRIAAGITFLNTPIPEASECIFSLKDAYQSRCGSDVFFREQGPTLAELSDGDSRTYSAEWILDEGGGVRISTHIRDDLKQSGITDQDLCLEASVIFVL